MKLFKSIWKSIKEFIVLPLNECPTCKSLYPDKYFQNGGGCRNCGFKMDQRETL